MIDLSENAIRYMYDLNNSRCMIYPIDRLVQILDLKPFKGVFLSATLSDGIDFNSSFLLNKKYNYGVYDVIKVENIMKSFERKDIIVISRCVKIQTETRPIGNPFEYPEVKTVINNTALIKGEKKKILKIQNIFIKRNEEIKKENSPMMTKSESINEMSVKKEPLKSVSINNNDNVIKVNSSSEIKKELSIKHSSSKKKSNNEFDGEVILDLNDLNNIIENQIDLTEDNKSREAINTQEYRLIQDINHSEIKRNIDEINRIEENKSNVIILSRKSEDTFNNILAIKQYEEFNSFENYSHFGVNEGADTVDKLINYEGRQSAKNLNSSPFSFGVNDLTSQFRMIVPGRALLESSKSKPSYIPLNLITDGMTNIIVKIRIVKIIRILESNWNFEIIDESKNTGIIKIPKKLIEKYREIFKIYDVFEISNCSTSVENNKKEKFPEIILEMTENTIVTHIKDRCDEIDYTEEDYVLINNLQAISTNFFSMLLYINKIDDLNKYKKVPGAIIKFLHLKDINMTHVRLTIKNDIPKVNLNEGDIIYIYNPIVKRANISEIYLETNILTVIFVNPVSPTVNRLNANIENTKVKNFLKNKINNGKITRIKLKELKELSKKENFDRNQYFLIKATIVDFLPKLFQYYDGCPKCYSKYKISINYNECEKCKIQFQHPKTYLKFTFHIQDCTGKYSVNLNPSICSKFLSYICKGIGLNEISADEYKRLSIDYNNDKNVEEIEKIIFFLKKSEFYFQVKVNFSDKTKNEDNPTKIKKIFLEKNNNIYFNVNHISPVDKKKETNECLNSIKLKLSLLN